MKYVQIKHCLNLFTIISLNIVMKKSIKRCVTFSGPSCTENWVDKNFLICNKITVKEVDMSPCSM